MTSSYLWLLKDTLAIIAFIIWLAMNGWLWASDLSQQKIFVRSMLLAVVGYSCFFGYLSYRHRD
jgi:hypothetical protein